MDMIYEVILYKINVKIKRKKNYKKDSLCFRNLEDFVLSTVVDYKNLKLFLSIFIMFKNVAQSLVQLLSLDLNFGQV